MAARVEVEAGLDPHLAELRPGRGLVRADEARLGGVRELHVGAGVELERASGSPPAGNEEVVGVRVGVVEALAAALGRLARALVAEAEVVEVLEARGLRVDDEVEVRVLAPELAVVVELERRCARCCTAAARPAGVEYGDLRKPQVWCVNPAASISRGVRLPPELVLRQRAAAPVAPLEPRRLLGLGRPALPLLALEPCAGPLGDGDPGRIVDARAAALRVVDPVRAATPHRHAA